MGMATESQFHVLAVDDSLIDRKLIEKLLRTSSYHVTTVDSGSKALEVLGLCDNEQSNTNSPSVSPNNHQELEVNLVITDYCMPGMTGYDLLKKIKESSTLRNIPVVIMSSENVPSRINRCLEEGAEEFFLKPVRLADLNRLKPHMMKTKLRHQKQEKTEIERVQNEQQQQETPQPQHQLPTKEEEEQQQKEEESLQQQQQEGMNNKRKTMENGISAENADRTRPRYNGITTTTTTTVDESLPNNFPEFQNVIPI